jgi:hypothetical protein
MFVGGGVCMWIFLEQTNQATAERRYKGLIPQW